MKIKFPLIFIFLLMSGRLGYSQVIIRPSWNASSVVSLGNILNLTFDNTLPSQLNVTLQINLENDKNELIAQGSSRPVTINSGTTMVGNELTSLMNYSYSGLPAARNLMATQMFDPGEYHICYKLINSSDNSVLGDFCSDFTVKSASVSQTIKNTKKSPIVFHGTSEILFNYSSSQSNYTIVPPTYLNWNLNPQLTLFDVPISGRLFLTTMQVPGQQNMNSFNLNFDVNQFRTVLKTKLLDLMKQNKHLNKIANLNFDSYAEELSNIKGVLANPAVLDEMKKLGELDSMQNILKNVKEGASNIKNSVNDYKSQYDGLKNDFKGVKSVFSENDSIKTDSLNVKGNPTEISFDSLGNPIKGKVNLIRDSLNSIKDSLMSVKDSLFRIKDKYMGKVDSMKNVVDGYINDPSKLGTVALDSLKKKIKALEWLESKKVYYDQLMEKKKKIEDFGKKLGLIDSTGKFSIDKYKDIDVSKLANPDYLFSKLKSSKLLRKFDKFLYSVKSFSLGASNPVYSDLTLSGMTVNGFSVEVEPFKIYGAFTYGQIMNPVLTTNVQFGSYKRMLTGGKFGYGRKEESHIHFTILSATDDSNSVNPRDSLYINHILPKDNKVIGMDGKLNLFKKKLIISVDLSGSQTIKDLSNYTNPASLNIGPNPVSEANWFVNILSQNHNVNKAVVDYAVFAKVEGNLFKNKTTISASFKRVGPNYYSFGLPFLIRDMMTFEIKISQKLWKNRISLSGFVRHNNDNLSSNKPFTTRFYTYGLNIALNIPNFPSFKAGLTPITLQNDSSYLNMMVFNATLSHSYKIRTVKNISNLSFINQSSSGNDSNLTFNISYLNLYHSIILKKGPSINLNGSYIHSTNNGSSKNTWVAGLGTGITLFKIWNNNIGGNIYVNERELKWGAYLQTGISFLQHFTFNLRVENNQFNSYIYLPGVTDYTQFICRTSLIAKW